MLQIIPKIGYILQYNRKGYILLVRYQWWINEYKHM